MTRPRNYFPGQFCKRYQRRHGTTVTIINDKLSASWLRRTWRDDHTEAVLAAIERRMRGNRR